MIHFKQETFDLSLQVNTLLTEAHLLQAFLFLHLAICMILPNLHNISDRRKVNFKQLSPLKFSCL